MNERLNSTFSEFRAATTGVAQDVSAVRGKVDKLQHIQNTLDGKLHETIDKVGLGMRVEITIN